MMNEPEKIHRRDFLGRSAVGMFLLAACTATFGLVRLLKPSVFPDPMRRFKIGNPDSIPLGETKEIPEMNVVVVHDQQGFYAISKVCTHLGCVVQPTSEGFVCPCHGSRFSSDGKVMAGPAPRPLDWIKIEQAPDGSLVGDAGVSVRPGTRFPYPT